MEIISKESGSSRYRCKMYVNGTNSQMSFPIPTPLMYISRFCALGNEKWMQLDPYEYFSDVR